LVITGKTWFGTAFRMEVALEKIKSLPDEVMAKDEMKTALIGAPGAAATLLGAAFGGPLYSMSPVQFYSVLAGGAIAMIIGFFIGGRVKACVFKNRDEAVLFDLTERGNSRSQFDAFVAMLRSRIQSAQR